MHSDPFIILHPIRPRHSVYCIRSIMHSRFAARTICAVLGVGACLAQGAGEWKSLFDGSSLKGWRETPFTRHGQVRVEDGSIVLGTGAMTGITWTGGFPKSNYEIRLEAMRVDGSDFFAGITFPVNDSFCTWINGGWGGTVVGLSSLDDEDAAENDSSLNRTFQSGRWYALRLRVTANRIQAWIDEQPVIDADIGNRTVGLRPGEIELSCPLGIASYSTTARLRKIEYREIAAGR